MVSPSLERLRDQVMSKAFELAIAVLHLIVLGVKDHRLLDLLNVALIQYVLANRQLLEAEIGLKSIADLVASVLRDSTVKDFKLDQGHVVAEELSDGLRTNVGKVGIAELQGLEMGVGGLEDGAHLRDAVAVDVAVGDVDGLDVRVGLEDVQKQQEVLFSDIVFRKVDVLNAIGLAKRN